MVWICLPSCSLAVGEVQENAHQTGDSGGDWEGEDPA